MIKSELIGCLLYPGTATPSENIGQERHLGDVVTVYNSNVSLPMQQQRERLPIFKFRTNILYCVEKYQTTIIIGETGQGPHKLNVICSTQLKQPNLMVFIVNFGDDVPYKDSCLCYCKCGSLRQFVLICLVQFSQEFETERLPYAYFLSWIV